MVTERQKIIKKLKAIALKRGITRKVKGRIVGFPSGLIGFNVNLIQTGSPAFGTFGPVVLKRFKLGEELQRFINQNLSELKDDELFTKIVDFIRRRIPRLEVVDALNDLKIPEDRIVTIGVNNRWVTLGRLFLNPDLLKDSVVELKQGGSDQEFIGEILLANKFTIEVRRRLRRQK